MSTAELTAVVPTTYWHQLKDRRVQCNPLGSRASWPGYLYALYCLSPGLEDAGQIVRST